MLLASVTDVGGGSTPPWHLDEEYISEVPFDIFSSSALSDPKNDGQRLAHLQLITHTNVG